MESSNDCPIGVLLFQIVAHDDQKLEDILTRMNAGSVECGDGIKIAKRVRESGEILESGMQFGEGAGPSS